MSKVDFKIEGSKLKIIVDTDKDGVPLLELSLEMSEIPSEIFGAFSKKDKEEK